MKNVYTVINNLQVHNIKVFTSLLQLNKFYKNKYNNIEKYKMDVVRYKILDKKDTFDIGVTFHSLNGCNYNIRVQKTILNK